MSPTPTTAISPHAGARQQCPSDPAIRWLLRMDPRHPDVARASGHLAPTRLSSPGPSQPSSSPAEVCISWCSVHFSPSLSPPAWNLPTVPTLPHLNSSSSSKLRLRDPYLGSVYPQQSVLVSRVPLAPCMGIICSFVPKRSVRSVSESFSQISSTQHITMSGNV